MKIRRWNRITALNHKRRCFVFSFPLCADAWDAIRQNREERASRKKYKYNLKGGERDKQMNADDNTLFHVYNTAGLFPFFCLDFWGS